MDERRRLTQTGESALTKEDWPKARESFQALIELDPDSLAGHLNLARALVELRAYAEAEKVLDRALMLKPEEPYAKNLRGVIATAKGETARAVALFQEVIKHKPDYAVAYNNIGQALQNAGWPNEAIQYYRKAVELDPDLAVSHLNLAIVLIPQNLEKEALHHLEIALRLRPNDPQVLSAMVAYMRRCGRVQEAEKYLTPIIENGTKNVSLICEWGDLMRSMKRPRQAIPLLEEQLQKSTITQQERRSCHFLLGKLYDAATDYAEAFKHFEAGHALKGTRFDGEQWRNYIDRLTTVFSRARMDRLPRSSVGSNLPIFIVGMFRSGTSLVEQVLSSHSTVSARGELKYIGAMTLSMAPTIHSDKPYPECIDELDLTTVNSFAKAYLQSVGSAPGIERITDKLPGNYLHLGLIELLFPEARVIHCVRNPLDTCLSCYFQDFIDQGTNPSELEEWGQYYRGYRELMAHWKRVLQVPVLDVEYEQLVKEPDSVVRRILDFCGLAWEEACLEFHHSTRFVATASHAQVRMPLHDRSIGRYRHYEQHLAGLKATLEA